MRKPKKETAEERSTIPMWEIEYRRLLQSLEGMELISPSLRQEIEMTFIKAIREILKDYKKELLEEIKRKITKAYPFTFPLTFTKDMGTHAEGDFSKAVRGINEGTYQRMATQQEEIIIENFYKLLADLSAE